MANDKCVIVCVGVIVAILVLFLLFGCKVRCSSMREGYRPGGIASQNYGLRRTPVDFVFKGDNGYQKDPHYQTDPTSYFQPLENGPIDFEADTRRIDGGFQGKVFDFYDPNYPGRGKDIHHIPNDTHTRFNLTNIGAMGKRDFLDNLYNPRFGPPGYAFTAQRFIDMDPVPPLYGGLGFLTHDKIGD